MNAFINQISYVSEKRNDNKNNNNLNARNMCIFFFQYLSLISNIFVKIEFGQCI